jgi:N-acetylmuramoyl-L-alanine amidase
MNSQQPVVVLDPGHGGNRRVGGSSPNNATGPNGLLEKNLTLDLARRTRDRLTDDARVLLTRDDDVNLSLSERAAVARNGDADLFLSIHFNGFRDSSVDGTSVFIAEDASQASRDFAAAVLQQVLTVTNVRDRGIRQQDFGVLLTARHAQNTAACLLETAFLTNPEQARRLEDADYRTRLAEAIAVAIRSRLPAPVAAPQAVAAAVGAAIGGDDYEPAVSPGFAAYHRAGTLADIAPDFSHVSSVQEFIRLLLQSFQQRARFRAGIEDSTFFPHSAICQLRITLDDGGTGIGTGFYIGPDRILTAAHNLIYNGHRAVAIEIFPGRAHNQSTFASFLVNEPRNFVVNPIYRPGSADDDLGVIKVDRAPPNMEYFPIEELWMNPGSGIAVCGYAASEDVNENQQNIDVDSIRELDNGSFTYGLHTRGGTSGSPVFYTDGQQIMAVGVHSRSAGPHVNRGCRFTDAKILWIEQI